MVLTLRQAGHTHSTPGNWFVYCVVLFLFFLHHTFSASHPTSSKNKVRVYWLNVRGVKITEQRLKASTVDWACWGGSMQLSPTHWDFEASAILPPSLGPALTCLTLPTVTCQDQHSSSRKTEERRGPAEYFDTTPPSLFQTTQQRLDQNNNSSKFTNWCN